MADITFHENVASVRALRHFGTGTHFVEAVFPLTQETAKNGSTDQPWCYEFHPAETFSYGELRAALLLCARPLLMYLGCAFPGALYLFPRNIQDDITEIAFDRTQLGSTGLRMVAARIKCSLISGCRGAGHFEDSFDFSDLEPLSRVQRVCFRNAMICDSMIKYVDGDWDVKGAINTAGVHDFVRALASPESAIKYVEIKGYMSESGVDELLRDSSGGETWRAINKKEVAWNLDLNTSLNPDNTRQLTEKLKLLHFGTAGNQYEGDGVNSIAEMMSGSARKHLETLTVDGSPTTDFQILNLLAAVLLPGKLRELTIVWLRHPNTPGNVGSVLAQMLLGLGKMRTLTLTDYYRIHHLVDVTMQEEDAAEQLAAKSPRAGKAQLAAALKLKGRSSSRRRNEKAAAAAATQDNWLSLETINSVVSNLGGAALADTSKEATAVYAYQITLTAEILAYPISVALRIADVCEVVALRESRKDISDMLGDVEATRFETIATDILDECQSELEAERVLRGTHPRHKNGRIIPNRNCDLFSWILQKPKPPSTFVCSRWCQNYINKLWVHADVSVNLSMSDHYYFGEVSRTRASAQPCDWEDSLRTISRTFFRILGYGFLTLFLLPFYCFFDLIDEPPAGRCSHLTELMGSISCFWSVPKVKYTLHMMMYMCFLVFLYLTAYNYENDWLLTTSMESLGQIPKLDEIYVYVYIVAFVLSELQQLQKNIDAIDFGDDRPRSTSATQWHHINKIWQEGISAHFFDEVWNTIDLLIIICFLLLIP